MSKRVEEIQKNIQPSWCVCFTSSKITKLDEVALFYKSDPFCHKLNTLKIHYNWGGMNIENYGMNFAEIWCGWCQTWLHDYLAKFSNVGLWTKPIGKLFLSKNTLYNHLLSGVSMQ